MRCKHAAELTSQTALTCRALRRPACLLLTMHSFHTSLPDSITCSFGATAQFSHQFAWQFKVHGTLRYSIACTGCNAGEDGRPVAQLVPERGQEQKAPGGAVLPGQHGRRAVCTGSAVNPHLVATFPDVSAYCDDRSACCGDRHRACLGAHICINTCRIARAYVSTLAALPELPCSVLCASPPQTAWAVSGVSGPTMHLSTVVLRKVLLSDPNPQAFVSLKGRALCAPMQQTA